MSRLDDLEARVKALEDEIGIPRSGRPGFDPRQPMYPGTDGLHDGPYGYGSQVR